MNDLTKFPRDLSRNVEQTVRKGIDTIERSVPPLKDAIRPFYAVIGSGDLLVQQARTAPARLRRATDEIGAQVQSAPDQLRRLPAQVRTMIDDAVQGALDATLRGPGDTVVAGYTTLADRGENLVERVRRQATREELSKQAKTTVASAKATATGVRKTAEKATRVTTRPAGRPADASTSAPKASAKKSAPRKSAAKKTAPRKTAAKKTTAKKTTAKRTSTR